MEKKPSEYIEKMAQRIDREVTRLVTETYEKAKTTLEAKREKLEKVAKRLLEKKVIEGEELRTLIG